MSRTVLAGIAALLFAGGSARAQDATPAAPPDVESERAALALLQPGTPLNPTGMSVAAARADVNAHPRDPDRWNQLGESLAVAGRLAEAAEAFRRATRLPPTYIGRAFLYRDLAEVLEMLGDLEGALAAAQVSVRSWPLSRRPLFCDGAEVRLLTRLLVKRHDLAGARAFYRPIARRFPTYEICRRVDEALGGVDIPRPRART